MIFTGGDGLRGSSGAEGDRRQAVPHLTRAVASVGSVAVTEPTALAFAPALQAVVVEDGAGVTASGRDGLRGTSRAEINRREAVAHLADFWTYSCINCLRTLPYLKAWDAAYRADGLTIVGVHTPEFAFEREADNVRDAVRELGLRYPVALDPGYGTWNAWGNRYWPAKYFVDRRGRLRFAHFGEGEYGRSEQVIRELLAESGSPPARMASVRGADAPSGAQVTPETYLGWERLDRERQYVGSEIEPDRLARYRVPTSPLVPSQFAYEGPWRVESERIVAAGIGANLRLRFQARDVHLVLGGTGVVDVRLDGRRRRPVRVNGDRLYTLLRLAEPRDGLLELRFSPGVEAYAFTFG